MGTGETTATINVGVGTFPTVRLAVAGCGTECQVEQMSPLRLSQRQLLLQYIPNIAATVCGTETATLTGELVATH
jgi:hypothetical protein